MRALVFSELNVAPSVQEVAEPDVQDGYVRVRMSHAALNRRDVWITRGQYPKIVTPIVLGSDGVGTLLESTDHCAAGTRVVLYPGNHWGANEAVQDPAYEILGMPSQGTFAEQIAVPASHVLEAPSHLSDAEAAALPLAGLTAWRALFSRANLQNGERVLVTGVGGGVSSIAAQLALAAGAEVYITTGDPTKLERAQAMGCLGGALYNDPEYTAQLKACVGSGFDVIIDGAGGDGVGTLLGTLAPAGRFVFYGGTCGKWPAILPQKLFFRQVSLLASTMGSPKDFKEMLNFVSRHRIHPLVDRIFPLKAGPNAFEHLASGQQMGKVVISLEAS